MSRERLPDRRPAVLLDVIHTTHQGDPQPLIISVGRYDDGRPAEVFIDVPYQLNRTFNSYLGKDVATLISIALQHGASVEELRAAMGRSDVNVMGALVSRPHTICGTVLDAMQQE